MKTIIVSDIFGKTEALEEIALRLCEPTLIFEPYDGEMMNFQSESDAYSYFSSNVGIDKYSDKLCCFIKPLSEPLRIIGFSAGASAIWKISEREELSKVSNAIGFYGSQIRYYTNINPKFPIKLIFPANEKHFSVSDLIATIRGKGMVKIEQSEFLHGFMNVNSQNYEKVAYNKYIKILSKVSTRV
jgi:dienelactone hydrolase